MKQQDKQNQAYAKELLKLSLDESGELSSERVQGVLAALDKNPPRDPLGVLKSYLGLVQSEVAKSKAIVSYAGSVSQSSLDAIQSKMSAKYGRNIAIETTEDSSLIAGVRVRVDCDVYESSVAASLGALESSL